MPNYRLWTSELLVAIAIVAYPAAVAAHSGMGGSRPAATGNSFKGMGFGGMGSPGMGFGGGMGAGGMSPGGMGGGMSSPGIPAGSPGSGGMGSPGTGMNWSWSWPIWDDSSYGAMGSPYQTPGGMTALQYQYAVLQSQWAADERARMAANARNTAYRRPDRAPKAKPPAAPRDRERPAVTPPPPALTPADRAARKLKLAKLLAEDGKTADAGEYYAEIIAKYPGTPAAGEAERLLDDIEVKR